MLGPLKLVGSFLTIILLWAVLILGLPAKGAGEASFTSDQKIIGGKELDPSHELARSVVALLHIVSQEPDESFEICTASFLSDRVLLTAAHCLPLAEKESPQNLFIKVGVDAYDGGVRVKVDRALAHPEYDATTFAADLAVIRLEKPFADARPLRLVRAMDFRGPSLDRLSRVQAIGYGRSNVGRSETESYEGLGRLRSVDLLALDLLAVSSSEANVIQVDMNRGRGFCEGDSGGPALLKAGRGKRGIVGIASSFESRGGQDCNRYGYYTNVVPYLDWIRDTVRKIVK